MLALVALMVIMEIMWVARCARKDPLRAVGNLATTVTEWTKLEDKKLYRLIGYLEYSKSYRQIGFIGDKPHDL